jgi:hypothetical protein
MLASFFYDFVDVVVFSMPASEKKEKFGCPPTSKHSVKAQFTK